MKTVLVTGGAGFIGSHVAERLLEKGYRVVILDNLQSGKKEFVPVKATFIRGDVKKSKDVNSVFEKYSIDVIMHIAGQASTVTSFISPFDDVETNFLGTMNMVLAAVKYKVSRFLFASSMTVYGNTKHVPTNEEEHCRPISYYGVTKYAAERFIHATGDRIDLPAPFHATSFRMFNVYGPRQSLTNPYQGVLAIFIGNVMRNESINIFGDGEQGRDFVYVEDVADAWTDAVENESSFGQVFNIGSGKQVSINELIRNVVISFGKDPKEYPISYKDGRSGDQRFMEADITKAKNLLEFNPRVMLAEGLKMTIHWAKNS